MFVKSQKIALNRRSKSSSPQMVLWYNEIFDVTVGVLTSRTITLETVPVSGSENILLNGLVLYKAVDWDYTMNGNEIIFTNDLELMMGDTVRAQYQA